MTARRAPKARGPDVNLSDIPELMPGAQSSANPAQREHFESRCVQLHREELSEERTTTCSRVAAAGAGATAQDLEAMFPLLDTALVHAIFAEGPTPQDAISTLLALSAATAEPHTGGDVPRATTPPPRDIGVDDMSKFPSLMDGDGWQVPSAKLFEHDADAQLGSAWRDCAFAAKDLAAPAVTPGAPPVAWGRRRVPADGKSADEAVQEPMTAYEFRQQVGQRRIKNRLQYGRGRGGGAESVAGGSACTASTLSEDSVSEAPLDGEDLA
eukprot:NODE_14975_length_1075_cov_4.128692.p1 GENE.NODE_14975_length_1075_cov_4.128692~~NODE_14975_length_1075_cov_4.128692.p1  ORF type:complete len:269 (-),score=86.89 NODE_14975_length_1075_cov_4.128692:166-972(-)